MSVGLPVTALDLARRFVGLREVPGAVANPAILAMLQLETAWPSDDSVPWCSAFASAIAWLLDLPRPLGADALRARAWLEVGSPVGLADAEPAFDVVVLRRGLNSPGLEARRAPGHVTFYAGPTLGLGGNQGDAVSVAPFDPVHVLGVRRLYTASKPTAPAAGRAPLFGR